MLRSLSVHLYSREILIKSHSLTIISNHETPPRASEPIFMKAYIQWCNETLWIFSIFSEIGRECRVQHVKSYTTLRKSREQISGARISRSFLFNERTLYDLKFHCFGGNLKSLIAGTFPLDVYNFEIDKLLYPSMKFPQDVIANCATPKHF
jgi:hypothetical protein